METLLKPEHIPAILSDFSDRTIPRKEVADKWGVHTFDIYNIVKLFGNPQRMGLSGIKGKLGQFTPAQLKMIITEFKSDDKAKTEIAKNWGISRAYLYKIANDPSILYNTELKHERLRRRVGWKR